jgi:hypothetical protein
VATNSTNKTKQGRLFVQLVGPCFKMISVAKTDLKTEIRNEHCVFREPARSDLKLNAAGLFQDLSTLHDFKLSCQAKIDFFTAGRKKTRAQKKLCLAKK